MAQRRWQRAVRWTALLGRRVLGQGFANGVKAAIRRAQVGWWTPSWYAGELTLLITDATAAMFPGDSATLGWERHAAEVRRVAMPGDHFSFHAGEHADGFVELIRKELTIATGQGDAPGKEA